MTKTYRSAFGGLWVNILFSAYNMVIGIVSHSWWFLTIGAYYAVLSIVRFIILCSKQEKGDLINRMTGIMLMILSVPLTGIVILASIKDRGIVFHEIIMITIAVYTFSKIALASYNFIRSKRISSVRLKALRNISFADAFVSISSLQRSMLVSFGEMTESTARAMNIATGASVSIIVFILGANLLRKSKTRIAQPSDTDQNK